MRAKEFTEGEVVDFPMGKRMAQRGMQQDAITGIWNPIPDPNDIDYVVVSDEGGRQVGHATKKSRKEADIEAKKLRLKGINAYVIEM